MRTLLFASLAPHAGTTGVIAAVTQRLVYDGRRALALRLGASGDVRAVADAEFFATLPGARGRGGAPVARSDAAEAVQQLAGEGSALVEAGDGADLVALAAALDAGLVLVHRGAPDEDALLRLQNLLLAAPERFLGVVLTAVPQNRLTVARQVLAEAELPLLAAVPEDKLLYAPTIGEIVDALDADMLLGEEAAGLVIEELMIGPITTDPGHPYFSRHGNKAVITRSDKTDMQLAAMQTNTDCLILTGGLMPSPYTLDRAANEEIALVLTRGTTRATLTTLEDIFDRSHFAGERKLERLAGLLHGELDYPTLTAALS